MHAPAAVLWDMDGTLVDTEPYWMACEHELVDAFGGTWTEDDARSIIGFDLLDAAVELRTRGGVDLEPHEIVERMLDGVVARVRAHVPWRPGARRLLSELNALGVPCALVTMSWSRLVDAIVAELAPIEFQAVVTGEHVGQGKPHPEPYLLAAERLGVDPTECVAIEDSPTGVASAVAAGCVVVAVPNIVPIEAAAGRIVVPSLKDVTPQDLGRYLEATPPPVAPSVPSRRPLLDRRRPRRARRQPRSASPPSAEATTRRRAHRAPSTSTPGPRRGRSTTPCRSCRRGPMPSTSCRRSGGERPASTRSRSPPTRRPTTPSSSSTRPATVASRSWHRSSTAPRPA